MYDDRWTIVGEVAMLYHGISGVIAPDTIPVIFFMVRTPMRKTPKQLERHLKGVANHRRIEIVQILARQEGMTLDAIAEYLQCNIKTISEHTRKLVYAGLVDKRYKGRAVSHTLSPYGRVIHDFLRTF